MYEEMSLLQQILQNPKKARLLEELNLSDMNSTRDYKIS